MTYNEKIIQDLNEVFDEITPQIEEVEDRSAIFAFYIQLIDTIKKVSEEELLEKLLKMILAEGVISHAVNQKDDRVKENSKKS